MKGRGVARAFEQRLSLFAEKQTLSVGFVYLPVQRVNSFRETGRLVGVSAIHFGPGPRASALWV